MARKIIIGMALICAMVCLNVDFKSYEEHITYHTVTANDTLWNIAEQYDDNKSKTFDEFVYKIRDDNKQLFANGRHLQAGDVIKITYYTIKK